MSLSACTPLPPMSFFVTNFGSPPPPSLVMSLLNGLLMGNCYFNIGNVTLKLAIGIALGTDPAPIVRRGVQSPT